MVKEKFEIVGRDGKTKYRIATISVKPDNVYVNAIMRKGVDLHSSRHRFSINLVSRQKGKILHKMKNKRADIRKLKGRESLQTSAFGVSTLRNFARKYNGGISDRKVEIDMSKYKSLNIIFCVLTREGIHHLRKKDSKDLYNRKTFLFGKSRVMVGVIIGQTQAQL